MARHVRGSRLGIVSMILEFTKPVRVYSIAYQPGDRIEESDIPEGSLESLLRMGQIKRIKPVEATSTATPGPQNKPSGKRK